MIDHIEAINGETILGWRHFDVAKKLKELKKEELFTLKLIEPKKAFGKSVWFIFLREMSTVIWYHVLLYIS